MKIANGIAWIGLVVVLGVAPLCGQKPVEKTTEKPLRGEHVADAVLDARDELDKVRKELAQAKTMNAQLQRRLRAVDKERVTAGERIVLLLDEVLRLTEELEAAKGKKPN